MVQEKFPEPAPTSLRFRHILEISIKINFGRYRIRAVTVVFPMPRIAANVYF
jgi:hypothetical protein